MRDVNFKKRALSLWFLVTVLACLVSAAPSCLAGTSFVVIVNDQNSFSGDPSDMKVVVSRLFLKKQSAWPDGELVKPYDRTLHSQEHQRFVKDILNLKEGKLLEHWAKMKQIRGETPPRSIRAASILLKLIKKHKGGFGVVDAELADQLPAGIKVLFAF